MNIAIIGGGAAGAYAAIWSARSGNDVTVFEQNGYIGQKLRITGKGRCNLTNNCTVDEFMEHIPEGGKFLYSSLTRHTPWNVMTFFESIGVPLKTERGRRV
ncbi:MAG: NAD(P)/FAD-dependent oxidoreductase, partial [Oscillospiraceae bacterium]|nr:NAD(P)/FAD-dependent oxidoreductase [Oscillospiraceae bacterium]